jgi:gas vesicle protein
MSKGSGGVGSFLCGAIFGAVAGILLAPQSGADTRAYLKEKAQAYLDNADVLYENGRDRAVELYSTASGRADEASEQIKDKIEAARSRLSAAVGTAAGEGEVQAKAAVDAAAHAATAAVDTAAGAVTAAAPTPAPAPAPEPLPEKPTKDTKA